MKKLISDDFDNAISSIYDYEFIMKRVALKIFEEMGMNINDDQIDAIITFDESDKFTIHTEMIELEKTKYDSYELIDKELIKYFVNLEVRIKEYFEILDEKLPDIMKSMIQEISGNIVLSLYESSDEMIKNRDETSDQIKKDLMNLYKEQFKILKMAIEILTESFEYFSLNTDTDTDTDTENAKDEVIERILGEACLVSNEIYTLLENGFPDAALSRWRNLYEQSIIATFIYNNPIEVSQRYLDYINIDNYESMIEQQKYAQIANYEKIDKTAEKEVTNRYESLKLKYGNEFTKGYGWAADALKKKKVTFRDIEESVNIYPLRPYYKLACSRVHHSVKGIYFKLGNYPSSGNKILLGKSMFGLVDPFQLAMLSINVIVSNCAVYKINVDRLIIAKIINKLTTDMLDETERFIGKYPIN